MDGPDDPLTITEDDATGAPTIVGTAQVGETLTADTSGIADRQHVSFNYQWVANDGTLDTDISGATASTYTLKGQVANADETPGDPQLRPDPTTMTR